MLGQVSSDFLAGGEFFNYSLPWLLTFAVVYGFLDHYQVPDSKASRGVISLVFAFFVMPVAAPVMKFIQDMGAGLIVVVTGFLFFLVLLELTGTKKTEHRFDEEKGLHKAGEAKMIEAHPKAFGMIVVIILLLVFWGAGGFQLIGLTETLPPINWPTLFFLAMITIAVWWLVTEESESG